MQNRYSFADRSSDDVLAACEQQGLAFLPWAPIEVANASKLGEALTAVARAHDASQVQVAIAWLLARSPVILPIPGTSSIVHFEENLEAAQLELSQEELDSLEP